MKHPKHFPVLQYVNAPNLITTVGLLFGIAACFYLAEGDLKHTLICLALAMLMDLFDGYAAIKLNSKTLFGGYMDTLVDFFVCCIVPVWMVYAFVGNSILLIAPSAFYCVCGLWRLSHYNVTLAENRAFFTGLPVPGAAVTVIMAVWTVVNYGFPVWVCAAVFLLAGPMMVSCIKLKKYGLGQKLFWVIGFGFFVVVALS
jgi:CDP-diacylglycerol--serine O-phosphatidyltransferase